jgi:DNA polymerase-3 subunit epsilon
MLDLPLSIIPLAFLDFETTGLSPRRGDRVCEVALQRVVGSAVETSYATLINPQRPLSARSFAVNQISVEQLAQAPTFAAVAGSLRAALADTHTLARDLVTSQRWTSERAARLLHDIRACGPAEASGLREAA